MRSRTFLGEERSPDFVGWRQSVTVGAGWLLGVLAVLALLVMVEPRLAGWQYGLGAKLTLIATGVLPPIWFWFEFILFWKGAPPTQRPPLEEFKYTQENARNLWLAFGVVMVALFFK
jgi:hypothetical protein